MLSPFVTGISAGVGATTGLGLAVGGCAYAAYWPASQIFGTALVAPARPGELALTFDDGPNPVWTPRLLEVLASHGVRASFFLVGSYAQAQPALVREMIAAGHVVGNHSWSHLNLAFAPAGKIEEELTRTSSRLEQITGEPCRYFRPPFGARRPETLRVARKLGLVPVLWNAMTSDWKNPLADAIAERLSRKIDALTRRGRSTNIVLHDGSHLDPTANRAPSVAAADQLIQRYKVDCRFVSLDTWS
ncbi:MAG: polysaccharide deacetylase family protein [Terracidiphilus sp.]|jgi:peptidoglycan/xylan/chitin deacetylase (PgdA/CDA1 family)